ncbi:hypothetical protein Tsubulata_018618, partial [Turnera subulata]
MCHACIKMKAPTHAIFICVTAASSLCETTASSLCETWTLTEVVGMGDKRVWTSEEEVALVDILEELVVDGHRVDVGQFRPGSVGIIVAKLAVRIPNAKIGQKHVKNKMKRLKQKYSVAADMANYSGFGWDDARYCVIVDSQDILDEYLLVQILCGVQWETKWGF